MRSPSLPPLSPHPILPPSPHTLLRRSLTPCWRPLVEVLITDDSSRPLSPSFSLLPFPRALSNPSHRPPQPFDPPSSPPTEEKTENVTQYQAYLTETEPLRKELGILTREELYPSHK